MEYERSRLRATEAAMRSDQVLDRDDGVIGQHRGQNDQVARVPKAGEARQTLGGALAIRRQWIVADDGARSDVTRAAAPQDERTGRTPDDHEPHAGMANEPVDQPRPHRLDLGLRYWFPGEGEVHVGEVAGGAQHDLGLSATRWSTAVHDSLAFRRSVQEPARHRDAHRFGSFSA